MKDYTLAIDFDGTLCNLDIDWDALKEVTPSLYPETIEDRITLELNAVKRSYVMSNKNIQRIIQYSKNYNIVIVSNNTVSPIRYWVNANFREPYSVDIEIIGRDSVKNIKPHQEPLCYAELITGKPVKFLIGNSDIDRKAASNYGCKFASVNENIEADFYIESFINDSN